MDEVATKPKSSAKPPARHRGLLPVARIGGVVDRTAHLSDDVLTSLETGQRAAINAVGQFLITIEDAWPQQVAGSSDVAKRVTESGIEMTDRLVHTEYELLRNLVDSAAKSLASDEVPAKVAA